MKTCVPSFVFFFPCFLVKKVKKKKKHIGFFIMCKSYFDSRFVERKKWHFFIQNVTACDVWDCGNTRIESWLVVVRRDVTFCNFGSGIYFWNQYL